MRFAVIRAAQNDKYETAKKDNEVKMSNIFDLFEKIRSSPSATETSPVEFIVAGLGNPGKEYEKTRHNAGFMCIDAICEKLGVKCDRARFHALTTRAIIDGRGVLLMKPQTFMNLSGEAIAEAAAFYKIAPQHVIVIVDDIYLDVGRIRIRDSGSSGGHNGLKNIEAKLGSAQYPRIRIGVGQKPHPDYPLMDWVLSKFGDEDIKLLSSAFGAVSCGLPYVLKGDFAAAMQLCNGKRGA